MQNILPYGNTETLPEQSVDVNGAVVEAVGNKTEILDCIKVCGNVCADLLKQEISMAVRPLYAVYFPRQQRAA